MFICITMKAVRRIGVAAAIIICAIALTIYVINTSVGRAAWKPAKPGEGIRLPIIMYHSVTTSGAKAGEYNVTTAQLESDLNYLDKHGYKSIVIDDLLQYVNKGKKLPDKIIMLTFDDGQLNNLTYAMPLLEKYKMRAVFSVVGAFIERAERERDPSPAYAYMTWADIQKAAASGWVEIQNHSYNLHGGTSRMGFTKRAGETQAAFYDSLASDVSKMQRLLQLNAGIDAACFTYPFGLTCKDSASLLKAAGFKSAMTCAERVNIITTDPECLYHLDRFNRSGFFTTESFMKKLGIE
ncbi:MAG: polysaccharide deacetylase family protein [Oscillospiraceae bacterium]|nr:polysaccharide deacetylase family protein [Oscillospiraceae bacterium]